MAREDYKLKTLAALNHADVRTAMKQPGKWPTIPIGTIVQYVDMFETASGLVWAKIKGPNGSYYDVPPHLLEEYHGS